MTATYVTFKCDTCLGPGKAREKVFDRSKRHFCCQSCKLDWIRSDGWIKERDEKRIAEMDKTEHLKKFPVVERPILSMQSLKELPKDPKEVLRGMSERELTKLVRNYFKGPI